MRNPHSRANRRVGEFAVIAWCHAPRVTVFDTATAAEDRKIAFDRLGCLPDSCHGRHDIVRVRLGC